MLTFKHLARKYDAVWRKRANGKLGQWYKNLEKILNDLEAFNYAFSAYGCR